MIKLGIHVRTAAAAIAVAAAMGGAAVAEAPAASANVCSPFPTCLGGPGYFQVSGTPDNSLWESSGNPANGNWLRTIPNGYSLYVVCQANNGPREDGEPGTTWDLAWDGGLSRYVYVYDWWINTPPEVNGGYSWTNSAWHCNF